MTSGASLASRRPKAGLGDKTCRFPRRPWLSCENCRLQDGPSNGTCLSECHPTRRSGQGDVYSTAIHAQAGTADWHRHDLRRAAAIVMGALDVLPSTVVRMIADADPVKIEHAPSHSAHQSLSGLNPWRRDGSYFADLLDPPFQLCRIGATGFVVVA